MKFVFLGYMEAGKFAAMSEAEVMQGVFSSIQDRGAQWALC